MGTRQYIGARYVPKLFEGVGGSTDWAGSSIPYEALTIVTYMNNTYTSKKAVPVGVEITDTSYWAITGAYNAQVEEYRQEVEALKEELSNVVFEDVECEEGEVFTDEKIVSLNGSKVTTNTNSFNGTTLVEGCELSGNGNPTMYIDGKVSVEHCDVQDGEYSISLDVNGDNVDGVVIAHNRVVGKNYPVLTNNASGQDVLIDGNHIVSNNSDGVEINQPEHELHGVRVVDNFIEGSADGTGDCIGVGVAAGKQVVISNNVVKGFKGSGLHIEDDTEDIIVANNIFYDCKNYGAWLGNTSRLTGIKSRYKINNNIFKSDGTGVSGIFFAFDANSNVSNIELRDNIVDGFAKGADFLALGDLGHLDCDGLYIKNCTNGISTSKNLDGTITFENVSGELVHGVGQSRCDVEKIVSITPINPDNLIVAGTGSPLALHGADYLVEDDVVSGETKVTQLLKIGNGTIGSIDIDYTLGNIWHNPCNMVHIDIDTKANTLTATALYSYGAIGATFSIIDGYLCASSGTHGTGKIQYRVKFNGTHLT